MALQYLKLGGKEFDADRVKLTLEDAYTHVAGMTANMKKKDVAFLRETVASVEREAAMTGMTPRQVTAELLTRLESRPEGFKFVDAGNRVWDSKAYCEMLARTTLLNTSRQEYLDTCAENGADVVAVTVSGHCCDKCAVWENRLLSISGKTEGLPTVDEATAAGLFHPNCTHSVTEVDDYTREEEYNPDGTPKNGTQSEVDMTPNPHAEADVSLRKPLTNVEHQDVWTYTGKAHKDFNEYLAGNTENLTDEQRKEYDHWRTSLEGAIDKAVVNRKTEVFRGVGGDYAADIVKGFKRDGFVDINSFQSASTDPTQAVSYSGKYGDSATSRVVLKVTLKPGTHALPVGEEGLS